MKRYIFNVYYLNTKSVSFYSSLVITDKQLLITQKKLMYHGKPTGRVVLDVKFHCDISYCSKVTELFPEIFHFDCLREFQLFGKDAYKIFRDWL